MQQRSVFHWGPISCEVLSPSALCALRHADFASTPTLLKPHAPEIGEPHECTCFTSAQADCLQRFHPRHKYGGQAENAEAIKSHLSCQSCQPGVFHCVFEIVLLQFDLHCTHSTSGADLDHDPI